MRGVLPTRDSERLTDLHKKCCGTAQFGVGVPQWSLRCVQPITGEIIVTEILTQAFIQGCKNARLAPHWDEQNQFHIRKASSTPRCMIIEPSVHAEVQ